MNKQRTNIFLIGIVIFLMLINFTGNAAAKKFDSSAFGGFKARMIGPAVMSGRVTTIDVVLKDTRTIYVGTASHGVWKSVNDGTTYKQIFEKHTMSIGSLVIDQKNPDTVWVGTG